MFSTDVFCQCSLPILSALSLRLSCMPAFYSIVLCPSSAITGLRHLAVLCGVLLSGVPSWRTLLSQSKITALPWSRKIRWSKDLDFSRYVGCCAAVAGVEGVQDASAAAT